MATKATKSTKKAAPKTFNKKVILPGQAAKVVKITPGMTYGQLADKLKIGGYVLCEGPDRAELSASIPQSDTPVIAMPKGKAGA